MKKVALVFVVAVFVPSLVLAWLAVRSLRDQQAVLERQQAQLFQNVTDSVARAINDHLAAQQRQFDVLVEALVTNDTPRATAANFDNQLRAAWPAAEVGFCVTLAGNMLCPSPTDRLETKVFCLDNGSFLGNQEIAEVYRNTLAGNQAFNNYGQQVQGNLPPNQTATITSPGGNEAANLAQSPSNLLNYSKAQNQRKVIPVQQLETLQGQNVTLNNDANLSKVIPAEAQFRQIISEAPSGMIARFLQNKLRLMLWHRLERDPQLVYGVQLDLNHLNAMLRNLLNPAPGLEPRPDTSWELPLAGFNYQQSKLDPINVPGDLVVVVLDDSAKPVASTMGSLLSRTGATDTRTVGLFAGELRRPFVATEIGEALPHWEVAGYLRNPDSLKHAAQSIQLTLGLLILVLLTAIGVGSWLIVRDLNRHLLLARQKTDFVSNVSHELKTPLTSIRMFAELLAEGRVQEPGKQRNYLNIITAEAARLTRLINNVLDFARLERGQKNYTFAACDLTALTQETVATLRPHLETSGYKFDVRLPDGPVPVKADRDAVAQVLVNLLSNAEKYSNGSKEITLELERGDSGVELRVLDRGPGVPRECQEKIFEQFYRVNDSLTNAVPGSGLGLTLARQIAQAHGGEVIYRPRDDGGSCFVFRLPAGPTGNPS